MPPAERVALVVSVLNEGSTIDALLASVAGQSRQPDEIVVVDGGSTDDTLARLEAWQGRLPLRVLHAPGTNIAQARNRGIDCTTTQIVAITDAGVRLQPDWLANLLARLSPETDVVSGFFRPDPHTTFERAMGATVLPTLEDVHPETFLPSSRSLLLRKQAWSAVGGYPEWLDYCEDLVFDLALRRAGMRFAFAADASVWFRPRDSLGAFFGQYFLYARGDGKANLWLSRHAIRYATYAAGVYLVLGGTWRRLVLALGLAAYLWRPFERLLPQVSDLSRTEAMRAVILIPVIRAVGDVAKMCGYPVGVRWRLRR